MGEMADIFVREPSVVKDMLDMKQVCLLLELVTS